MENKNIVLLRHNFINVLYTNSFYLNQVDDNLADYVIVDVTSRCERNKEFMKEHPSFAKEISPLFIGPVTTSDGLICNNFETFWQCGKVYPCHYIDGKLTPEYFKWREDSYNRKVDFKKKSDKNLLRHPERILGYNSSDCLFNVKYENGEYVHLNYVESRKKLYIPEYCKLVYNTNSFKWLKSLVDEGKKIALVDFDAYNYYSQNAMVKLYESYVNKCKSDNIDIKYTLEDYLKIKSIKDVVNCQYRPAGHAIALKLLLEGDIEIRDGKVIDNIGVLD